MRIACCERTNCPIRRLIRPALEGRRRRVERDAKRDAKRDANEMHSYGAPRSTYGFLKGVKTFRGLIQNDEYRLQAERQVVGRSCSMPWY